MASPLRLLTACAAIATATMVAAAPPAHAQSWPAASRLATQVRNALRHSSARHIDYVFSDSGIGRVGDDASRATAPASNQKLFTTITLLDLVGSQFRYATTVSGTAPVVSGTLHGDLVLRAGGDPTLTKADLLMLAKRMHRKGLRRVAGRLIIDDTRYSHQTRVTGWKHKFVPVETGTVDAFTVDDNEWRGGSGFEADPTHANATLLRHALKQAHIAVKGRTKIGTAPTGLHRLVIHYSPDLAAIIDDTLTNSINFDAEMMIREAGAQLTGHGTPASGVKAEHTVAKRLGLPIGTAYDGSGLSYSDRESPATIEAWLAKLKTLPFYDTVYYALPLSCETGTLEGRLCGPNVRGRVRAKTGTLDHNTALSGYFETNSGHAVTFSILASGFKDKNFSQVMDHVNKAVEVVARNG